MKRSKRLSRIFAGLMAFAMIIAIVPQAAFAATPLPAPTNAEWGSNFEAQWDKVEGAEGEYSVSVYKDGVRQGGTVFGNRFDDRIKESVANRISGSGDYYFTVEAKRNGIGEIATSPTITYTRPSEMLETPANLKWKIYDDYINIAWDKPSNAIAEDIYYVVEVYLDGTLDYHGYIREPRAEMFISTQNTLKKDGVYTFTVKAISSRLDTMASSQTSALSPEHNLSSVSDDMQNLLENISNNNANATDALDAIKTSGISTAELAASMQANKGVLNSIKDIEEDYKTEKNIIVSSSVAVDISNRLDASKISVTGAALNATLTATDTDIKNVSLNFTVPSSEVVVDDSQYKNWVQLDIDLDGVPNSAKLDVPVQITMPIPTGVYSERFVILHYRNDGTYETIRPTINSDGTATFTVTRFSIFVFANEVAPASNNSNSSYSSSSDDDSTVYNTIGATPIVAVANAPVTVSATTAANLVKSTAKSSSGTIIVSVKNAGAVALDTFKAMTAAANGSPVKFNADSMNGHVIDVRISIDPTKAAKDLNLYASGNSAAAKNTLAHFGKYFSNKITVISLQQQGGFGTVVEIAVKIDPAIDTSNIVFYAYDKVANTYKRIQAPRYWVDKNGYVHFTTELAGDIIISDGALVRK